MGKQGRVGADDPSEPHPCPFGPGPEPLVLVAAPADQVGVYPPQGAAESRPIEVAAEYTGEPPQPPATVLFGVAPTLSGSACGVQSGPIPHPSYHLRNEDLRADTDGEWFQSTCCGSDAS